MIIGDGVWCRCCCYLPAMFSRWNPLFIRTLFYTSVTPVLTRAHAGTFGLESFTVLIRLPIHNAWLGIICWNWTTAIIFSKVISDQISKRKRNGEIIMIKRVIVVVYSILLIAWGIRHRRFKGKENTYYGWLLGRSLLINTYTIQRS